MAYSGLILSLCFLYSQAGRHEEFATSILEVEPEPQEVSPNAASSHGPQPGAPARAPAGRAPRPAHRHNSPGQDAGRPKIDIEGIGSVDIAPPRELPTYTAEDEQEATLLSYIMPAAFGALDVHRSANRALASKPCLDFLMEKDVPRPYDASSVTYEGEVLKEVNGTQTGALIVTIQLPVSTNFDIAVLHPGTSGGTRHRYRQLSKQALTARNPPKTIEGVDAAIVGFAKSYWSNASTVQRDEVYEKVLALTKRDQWSGRLVVAGYSMGGAVASLTANAFFSDKENEHGIWSGRLPQMAVYTFGSPRVANQAFSHHVDFLMRFFDVKWWRIVQGYDLVCHHPPYDGEEHVHHGIEVWYKGSCPTHPTNVASSSAGGTTGSGSPHPNTDSKDYVVDRRPWAYRLENPEDQTLSWQAVTSKPAGLADHMGYMGIPMGACNHLVQEQVTPATADEYDAILDELARFP